MVFKYSSVLKVNIQQNFKNKVTFLSTCLLVLTSGKNTKFNKYSNLRVTDFVEVVWLLALVNTGSVGGYMVGFQTKRSLVWLHVPSPVSSLSGL